ncbi:MAG: hypothetical protein ATN36_00990 [Epulopiscium sp. Nele67-Bin005]|nr:MAG: hypothetical protein ATN36_00990 [Epulopiscium sp. Nele67-Bin005]
MPRISLNGILGFCIALTIILNAYTIIIRFFIPTFGEAHVQISSVNLSTEQREIGIIVDNPDEEYYILVYEDDPDNNWIYFTHLYFPPAHDKIVDNFLPDDIEKYMLFGGDELTSYFSFQLRPNQPLNYMVHENYIFHLQYIVPYKFLFFPTFYYSKHSIFFIDPVM